MVLEHIRQHRTATTSMLNETGLYPEDTRKNSIINNLSDWTDNRDKNLPPWTDSVTCASSDNPYPSDNRSEGQITNDQPLNNGFKVKRALLSRHTYPVFETVTDIEVDTPLDDVLGDVQRSVSPNFPNENSNQSNDVSSALQNLRTSSPSENRTLEVKINQTSLKSNKIAHKTLEQLDAWDNAKLTKKVEKALKLGYSELQIEMVFAKIGYECSINELLSELVLMGFLQSSPSSGDSSPVQNDSGIAKHSFGSGMLASARSSDRLSGDGTLHKESLWEKEAQGSLGDESESENGERTDNLRDIILDGSNVAKSHGKTSFSCRGIQIAVDWFRARGHKNITVIVPLWRKEAPRPDSPITDQDILTQLEKERVMVFTPSRRVQGRRVICYDDRYMLQLAAESGGVVVSNDMYRDLVGEREDFRQVVDQRLLMYTFVNDRFMPPEDPLGRRGPTLDNFLRKVPLENMANAPACPYGRKCTYGNKCRFYHPERGQTPLKTISETLKEQASIKIQEKALAAKMIDFSERERRGRRKLNRAKSLMPNELLHSQIALDDNSGKEKHMKPKLGHSKSLIFPTAKNSEYLNESRKRLEEAELSAALEKLSSETLPSQPNQVNIQCEYPTVQNVTETVVLRNGSDLKVLNTDIESTDFDSTEYALSAVDHSFPNVPPSCGMFTTESSPVMSEQVHLAKKVSDTEINHGCLEQSPTQASEYGASASKISTSLPPFPNSEILKSPEGTLIGNLCILPRNTQPGHTSPDLTSPVKSPVRKDYNASIRSFCEKPPVNSLGTQPNASVGVSYIQAHSPTDNRIASSPEYISSSVVQGQDELRHILNHAPMFPQPGPVSLDRAQLQRAVSTNDCVQALRMTNQRRHSLFNLEQPRTDRGLYQQQVQQQPSVTDPKVRTIQFPQTPPGFDSHKSHYLPPQTTSPTQTSQYTQTLSNPNMQTNQFGIPFHGPPIPTNQKPPSQPLTGYATRPDLYNFCFPATPPGSPPTILTPTLDTQHSPGYLSTPPPEVRPLQTPLQPYNLFSNQSYQYGHNLNLKNTNNSQTSQKHDPLFLYPQQSSLNSMHSQRSANCFGKLQDISQYPVSAWNTNQESALSITQNNLKNPSDFKWAERLATPFEPQSPLSGNNTPRVAYLQQTPPYFGPKDNALIVPGDPRFPMYFHLSNIFPEELVRSVMNLFPHEINPSQLCRLIMTFKGEPNV